MKVFVAGATGSIGKRLVPQLVASGYEVVAMTRSPKNVEIASRHPWRSACGRALGTARATDKCGSPASGEPSVRVLDAGRSC